MSALFKIRLAPGDRRDIEAVAHDRFQSPRARKRCIAMLLLHECIDPVTIQNRSGLKVEHLQHMMERLRRHGVQAAIFGSPRPSDKRRYDAGAIAAVVAGHLKLRPPPGSLQWNLEQLVDVVRGQVRGAEDISKEALRQIIKKELHINSIRHVDPYWLQQTRRTA